MNPGEGNPEYPENGRSALRCGSGRADDSGRMVFGKLRRSKGISADWLKVLAMVAMVIDHVGAALFPGVTILRLIGRIAFPVYVWLLVVGFIHTASRKRYMLQMAVCALVSEVPFDLAFSGRPTFRWQNIYFSLLWGLILLTVLEKALDVEHRQKAEGAAAGGIKARRIFGNRREATVVLALVFFMVSARFLRFDYGCTGPVLVTVFYLHFRTGKPDLLTGFFLFSFSNLFTPVLDRLWNGGLWDGMLWNTVIWGNALATALMECFGVMSVPLLRRYNGIRKMKRGKWFFYLFYPLHLLVLYGIRLCFF